MSYRISDLCMNCQRCVPLCPKQAIYYDGVKMSVHEELCISCGTCKRTCLLDAPYDAAKPAPIPEKHELIEDESAVVVIGAGGVGLVAAAKLSQLTDEKIVVLEANTRPGGGAWFAHIPKIYGSKWQEEHNCGDYLQAHFLKYMDFTHYRLDPHLVYNCFESTGKFFDWIYNEFPQEIKDRFDIGFYHVDGKEAHPVPAYKEPHPELMSDCYGRRVMEQCLEICSKNGVEVRTQNRAVDVEVTDGKISAVISEDPGGRTRIRCKCVIIGCGSWISNREVLEKYAPRFAAATPTRSCHLNPYYRGDGIPLAEKAGAYVDYDSFVLRNMGPFYYDLMQVSEDRSVASISVDPRVIYVNKNGKRWMNECVLERVDPFATAIGLEYQPGCVSFTLFDTSILEKTVEQFFSGERKKMSIFGPARYAESWKEDIDKIASLGTHLRRANTLRELAEICGIDPDGLEKAVARYNEQCRIGVDDDYRKPSDAMMPLIKAPYYAVVCNIQTDGAFGGILVNENAQAYNKDKTGVVEGLYCGGDFASGRYIVEEGIKRQIIDDEAWAYATAYMAANHAAEYLKQQKA